jgi:hypothetical protein
MENACILPLLTRQATGAKRRFHMAGPGLAGPVQEEPVMFETTAVAQLHQMTPGRAVSALKKTGALFNLN